MPLAWYNPNNQRLSCTGIFCIINYRKMSFINYKTVRVLVMFMSHDGLWLRCKNRAVSAETGWRDATSVLMAADSSSELLCPSYTRPTVATDTGRNKKPTIEIRNVCTSSWHSLHMFFDQKLFDNDCRSCLLFMYRTK